MASYSDPSAKRRLYHSLARQILCVSFLAIMITSWATLGTGNIPLLIHSMPSGNGWQIGVSNPSGKTDVQFEAEVVYATFA
ncbi:MAG TPA: hypothetical protein VKR06_18545 [Ktedonosporobacter sp.]|nr:hypothetical protein [Ktedonosporobacter sp.]